MERGLRESQMALNMHCERVRAAEHAPRDPFCVSERFHGLAEIVERGTFVRNAAVGVPPEPWALPHAASTHPNAVDETSYGINFPTATTPQHTREAT